LDLVTSLEVLQTWQQLRPAPVLVPLFHYKPNRGPQGPQVEQGEKADQGPPGLQGPE